MYLYRVINTWSVQFQVTLISLHIGTGMVFVCTQPGITWPMPPGHISGVGYRFSHLYQRPVNRDWKMNAFKFIYCFELYHSSVVHMHNLYGSSYNVYQFFTSIISSISVLQIYIWYILSLDNCKYPCNDSTMSNGLSFSQIWYFSISKIIYMFNIYTFCSSVSAVHV